ncbi:AraC family transcriptional regulator [Paraglaciecola hydrolytica]|uniref:Transcriptional regulator n=1 Tax=Paraglaciecola hydrolytica TaxID=1799789 RepID=A0A136A3K8_9ALTE|nr:AraC family transcriptional regulator [Paraglaciecola hydrolytica]KXI29821.1 transcriptional regulator [Paraglaciecola hydrolytica]
MKASTRPVASVAYSADDKFIPAHQLAASLIDLAMSRGVDKNRLLRGTRIFYQDIRTGSSQLSAEQLLRLMANAKAQVGGYDCAFQLGRRLFPGNYGAISNALLHCRNMQDVLRLLNVFMAHICPFMQGYTYRDANQYHLVINDALGCGTQWQFIVETYFSAFVAAAKLLLGRRLPFHFDFPFVRPRYIQEYETNLGFRLNFSQPVLRIRFDLEWLKMPFNQQSQSLKWHAVQQLKQQAYPSQGFVAAVRDSLRHKRNQSLQDTAQQFAMSPATFKRKLQQHGVRFQQLQDELGLQQAIYLLQVKKLNNEDSAHVMEFSDIPNFRRAVKRWTGFTPTQLRIG